MASVFGYEIESGLDLVRLRDMPGERGTIRVVRVPDGSLEEPITVTAIDHMEMPDGDWSTFVIGRSGARTICGCAHTGIFRLDPKALVIEMEPRGEQEMWEHRLLSVIIPILLSERGEIALHGGAVEIGGRAVIFCGPPIPLGALLLLRERGGEGIPKPVDPAAALVGFAPHLMHAGGLESVRPAFSALAGVVGSIPCFDVSVPDDMALRHASAQALAEAFGLLGAREA